MLSSLEQRDSELTSMVDPLPSHQTTCPWNPSPRRTWQTNQPGYSTCYCASSIMITSSIAVPVRKWPCLTCSLDSVHVLGLTSHWTLPFTMPTCPQSGRKHFNKPSWVFLRCTLLLTSSSPVGQMISRWFLALYVHTDNTMRPSLLKMVLFSVEKPSLFLNREGEDTTSTTPVPSRNHQSPVAHMWMHLLAQYKKAIEKYVHQCETCTWFQAAHNAAAPLTPTPTPSHP